MAEAAPGQRRRHLVTLTGGQLGGILALHKGAGRGKLGAFAVLGLGKKFLHRGRGRIAVNALGVQVIHNFAARFPLAQ